MHNYFLPNMHYQKSHGFPTEAANCRSSSCKQLQDQATASNKLRHPNLGPFFFFLPKIHDDSPRLKWVLEKK